MANPLRGLGLGWVWEEKHLRVFAVGWLEERLWLLETAVGGMLRAIAVCSASA